MDTAICPNCEKAMSTSEKFCQQCGQQNPVHRLTIRHFLHEFTHAFTHTDKGIFHLLKCLATKPGTTAREYLQGKRKKYFNPFTFFLIIMGFFVLSSGFFSNRQAAPTPTTKTEIVNNPSKSAMQKRAVQVREITQKHGNIVAMFAIPFISFFSWAFFRKRGFYFAEHLTANMMFIAFANLVFVLLVFPVEHFSTAKNTATILIPLALALQVAYFTWAWNGFLQLHGGMRLKSFAVALFSILSWMFFSMLVMAFYIYQNKDFLQFFSRMSGK